MHIFRLFFIYCTIILSFYLPAAEIPLAITMGRQKNQRIRTVSPEMLQLPQPQTISDEIKLEALNGAHCASNIYLIPQKSNQNPLIEYRYIDTATGKQQKKMLSFFDYKSLEKALDCITQLYFFKPPTYEASLVYFYQLTHLSFIGREFNGTSLAFVLQHLPYLKKLIIMNNDLSTSHKAIITALTRHMLPSKHTQSIAPVEVQYALYLEQQSTSSITHLHFLNTNISQLAPEIGALTALKELTLAHNNLKKLPEEIGKLDKLEALRIDHNPLTYLPIQLGKLSKLKYLNISNHRFNEMYPIVLAALMLGNAHIEGLMVVPKVAHL